MTPLKTIIINTREDLDSVVGTKEHFNFMEMLKGSMTRKVDIQTYPEGYGKPEYEGEKLEPIWQDVEDLSTIERFGFQTNLFNNKYLRFILVIPIFYSNLFTFFKFLILEDIIFS